MISYWNIVPVGLGRNADLPGFENPAGQPFHFSDICDNLKCCRLQNLFVFLKKNMFFYSKFHDTKAGRSIAVETLRATSLLRKVRATQDAMLPNGKAPRGV